MVGFWVLGFGFWVLGFGFWVLGFGFWVLGCLVFVFFGRGCVAGGSPAATHFLCFAKESKQRKATAIRRPLRGYPVLCRINRESRKLAALRHASLFFRLLQHITGDA